jgi:hypothetical protein
VNEPYFPEADVPAPIDEDWPSSYAKCWVACDVSTYVSPTVAKCSPRFLT